MTTPSPSFRPRRIADPAEQRSSVTFTFNGRSIKGFAGEPIAAALIADGERVFRLMPGSGEPRGGYCMVGRCADCLVVVDGVAGIRACMTPVADGMDVRTQDGYQPVTGGGHA